MTDAEQLPAATQPRATTCTDTARAEAAAAPVLITADQASLWAGRPLGVDDMHRLADCIPHSSIPEAIDTIVCSWDD